jgi:ubiquinone/menaquinone biosynthesis C-methylase UbiE
MSEYLEANRRHWDELVAVHAATPFYDVDGFRAGKCTLKPTELDELGDVRGKSLLHLQCHFGLDTLSWARRGATVTGVDFSRAAIDQARALASESGIDARFIQSDVYALPDALDERFDIVFTSYGVLFWLADIERWASVAARFLEPGGTFYIIEFHPVMGIFEKRDDLLELQVAYPYFAQPEPLRFEDDGSYADRSAKVENRVTYSWTHSLADVVSALIAAGLRIDFLHEFPHCSEQFFPFMEERSPGKWYLTMHDGSVPLLYSIKATKPGMRLFTRPRDRRRV